MNQNRLRRLRSQLGTLRGVAPDARWSAGTKHLSNVGRKGAARARRRAITGQIRAVELAAGVRRANQYFWRTVPRSPVWFDVQRRIDRLAIEHPGDTEHFVLESIDRTNDPVTVAGMALHPLCADVLRGKLLAWTAAPQPALTERIGRSRVLGGAFIGAAHRLLDSADRVAFERMVTDIYQLPDDRLYQVAASMGARLNDPGAGPARIRATARHRLVIAESLDDVEAFSVLLAGAEHVTLIATSDTFGTADFSSCASWPGVGNVTVEHIRSRITRFSQPYIDLHQATASVAPMVVSGVAAIPGFLEPSDRKYLEVEIADFLFFQALKIRSIEILLDDDFDEIVLATANQRPSSEFLRLMSHVHGLATDPRVEVVSVSRSIGPRVRTWATLDQLARPIAAKPPRLRDMPRKALLRQFDNEARTISAGFVPPPTDRTWVAVITANNSAYNDSTASYIAAIHRDHDVRVVNVGRNATDLVALLSARGLGAIEAPIDFLAPKVGLLAPLGRFIEDHLLASLPGEPTGASVATAAAHWALQSCMKRLSAESIAPTLVSMRAVNHWFSELTDSNHLPGAVVLTPQRTVGVGAVSSAARRAGVPSVVLEPHAQDANYCRYIKIGADYYGVMSDYFRTQTAEHFGIGSERTFVVGSPRQVAPANYDPIAAQVVARQTYAAAHDVEFDDLGTYLVFFCQPSEWGHMSTIWSHALSAAKENDCIVLLKTHPEESISRTAKYLAQASEQGASNHVMLLDCDAATAIALGDIVLTAYSAAAIDAAIRQCPVVCITDGDLRYPVDLPAIIGAQLASSASELSAIVAAYVADPALLRAQARALIERENQFVEGPGPRLSRLLAEAIDAGPSGARRDDEIPSSLFLDGPHPVFPV
jgi:hypothetical protein